MSYPPEGLSDTLAHLPEWIKLGCGIDEYICTERGATFPGDICPDKLPDLSKHNNLLAEYLFDNPDVYNEYKDLETIQGITLSKCIKTGIDNPGHPHIKTCGLVAGDEDSFTIFKKVFDRVISDRHNGYPADGIHPTDLDINKLSNTKIDPTGKYVLSSRCRTGRNVRGMPLPPACNFEQRRELERVVILGLSKLEGELEGKYYGLNGCILFHNVHFKHHL